MHLIGARLLGKIIMALFCLQGVVMLFSPGSLRFQKPGGGAVSWIYNLLNLFIIVVVTPLIGILLIKKAPVATATGWIAFGESRGLIVLETAGMLFFFSGNMLLYWSRIFLGRSFRLGGVVPGAEDKFVTSGPYRLVRHPMYSAVLLMALGLALLIQSLLVLALFVLLAGSIVLLIPAEEVQLADAYGAEYREYRRKVKALFPFIY